jgi:hypothetical protein
MSLDCLKYQMRNWERPILQVLQNQWDMSWSESYSDFSATPLIKTTQTRSNSKTTTSQLQTRSFQALYTTHSKNVSAQKRTQRRSSPDCYYFHMPLMIHLLESQSISILYLLWYHKLQISLRMSLTSLAQVLECYPQWCCTRKERCL